MTKILEDASATSEPLKWVGGRGTFEAVAGVWGTVTLEYLSPDDSTWVAMGSDTTLIANGGGVFTIGPGTLRAAVSGATGVYAIIHRAKQGVGMAGSLIAGTDSTTLHSISDSNKQYTGKSYRRIWWNSYESRYDALLPKDDSGSADHYIVKGVDGTPSWTSIELEDRSSGRPGIYWDDANKKLHCFSAHNTTTEFWTVTYTSETDEYDITVGAAGAGVEVPGMDREYNGAAMGMTKSPNGDIWLFCIDDPVLKMQHSTNDGVDWETTATTLVTTNGDGAVDCGWFANGGTNYVCVFGSEDDLVGSAAQYFYFIDEDDASPTTPGNWDDDNSLIPTVDDGAVPDNHVCMARASNGTLGIVYKQGGTGEDDVKLITRTAAGSWGGTYEVWNDSAGKTRPTIAVKKISGSTDEEFIITAADTGGGQIVHYKTTPVDTISLSSATVIFEDTVGSDNFNDTVTYQGDFVADSDSGYLVIVENITDETLWYNKLSIIPPASVIIVSAHTESHTQPLTRSHTQALTGFSTLRKLVLPDETFFTLPDGSHFILPG